MSMRSILEINHDYADVIKRDPIGFAQVMLDLLRGGNNEPIRQNLRHYGVVVAQTVHHSTPRKVVLPFGEYPL